MSFIIRTLSSAALTLSVLSVSFTANAKVSQAPLILVEGVAPNMLFTLDESGSMSWGYVPDQDNPVAKKLTSEMGRNGSHNDSASVSSRRFYSNRTNPIYYSPHVIYEIPPAFKDDEYGTEYKLETSFEKAPINGFVTDDVTKNINLSNDYIPIYEHRLPLYSNDRNNIQPKYAEHPNYPGNHAADNGVNDVGRDHGKKGVKAYYYEFDGSLTHTVGSKNSSDIMCSERRNDEYLGGERCYRVKYVTEISAYDESGNRLKHPNGEFVDGRENFAIWFSFYKSRALATLSAASIAFYDLSPNVRFSWQNLATCRSFDGKDQTHCKKNGFQPYTNKHRGQFYSWLREVYFNVGTPLPAAMIRAGDFYKTDMPWKMYPQDADVGTTGTRNTKKNTLACRPSYHVLMTDGMWNTRRTYTHIKNNNKWTGSYGSSVTYPTSNTDDSLPAPYGDRTKNTLADIAMHYWKTDLKEALDNKVPAFIPIADAGINDPRNNPATWQHMSNFIMGLGLTNSLNDPEIPWEGQTHKGIGYQRLKSGAAKWPSAGLEIKLDKRGNPTGVEEDPSSLDTNVYDLWHAAINSRGEFYSVESPEAMVNAFKDILGRIAERQSTAALPAVSSSVEEEQDASTRKLVSYSYQSSFDSTDWSGDIEKIKRYKTIAGEVVSTTHWKASAKVPSDRNIKIAMGNNALQDFTVTNAPQVLKDSLRGVGEEGNNTKWQERLKYIRGDRAKEGSPYRVRSSLLGDFLGSQPVIVSGGRYLRNIANKVEGNDKYSTFLETHKNRRSQLYIGGNDGMLHAFDTEKGVEKFAFVPTSVFKNLINLTEPTYGHHYYVDGTPVVADVYDGNKWRTILVGTLGAGGKGMFALDVTNPDEIKLLWEKNENDFGSVKLGYSFSKPTVARLHNGEWAVVTGNGYDAEGSSNGKAALYIMNAIDGTLIKSLEVQGNAETNGLSTPKLVDYDADGVADYAYAGDLQGNLWRFDLLGNSASENKNYGSVYGNKNDGIGKFKVSYGGKPIFKATVSNKDVIGNSTVFSQPITAAPTIARNPNGQGYLVVFGTGKYFEVGDDAGAPYVQSVYAILDEKTNAQSTINNINIDRTKLVRQSFIEEVIATNEELNVNRDARIISSNKIDLVNNKGWVLDLQLGTDLTGEMIVEGMRVVGNTLLLQTLVPDDDPCAAGAGNWLYAINLETGGQTLNHVFDTRYKKDEKTTVVSGLKIGAPGGVALTYGDDGGLEVSGESIKGALIGPAGWLGRQTWRVVPNP